LSDGDSVQIHNTEEEFCGGRGGGGEVYPRQKSAEVVS